MSPFPSLMKLCGLSQEEAAAYLGVRLDTVKSWSAGRREPGNPGIIDELRHLWRHIRKTGDGLVRVGKVRLRGKDPAATAVVFWAPSTAGDLRTMGFTSIGAWMAVIGYAAAGMPDGFSIYVERGAPGEELIRTAPVREAARSADQ